MSSTAYAEKILRLEKEIAYFFGVREPELVASHYIEAIKLLEQRNSFTTHELRNQMLPHLEAAYTEVKKQTRFIFDIQKAAYWELELFMANIEHASFEREYMLLLNIYKEVFGTITDNIKNAAMLRTFLYKYKDQLMSSEKPLSNDDFSFLKQIAQKTEIELGAYTCESD